MTLMSRANEAVVVNLGIGGEDREVLPSPWVVARQVLGSPKICKLAHVFLWEYSYKRPKLA